MGKAVDTASCPSCKATGGDWDDNNLVVYADKSVHCFACGYNSREEAKWIKGEVQSLEKSRSISEATCKFYNYKVGKYTGSVGVGGKKRDCKDEWVRIMEWYEDGKLVMQKIKTQLKEMRLFSNTQCKRLWGMDKFQPTDKLFLTITEGEEDAMAIAECQGCQFPVVSLPGGSNNADEILRLNLPWIQKFKYVILAFDNDPAGKQAIHKVLAADLFEPGKVRIAEWPLKDANDMLRAGMKKEIIDCLFRAKVYEPDHIVSVSQVIEQVMEQPQFGLEYPWPTWNKWTYGLRFNEITTLVGPSGIGKTEIIKDIVSHFLKDMNVGVFSFEQTPADTIRRYAGSKLGLKLQKPGEVWDIDLIRKTAMEFDDKVFLYDFNGTVDIKDIFYSIRYMNKAKGCRLFVIDNLKSLKVVLEKQQCAEFAVGLKALVKDLGIHVILVSHVNKDGIRQSTHVGFSSKVKEPHSDLTEDSIKEIMNKFALDWQNGRMPTASNIEGGNDIEAISDYVIAIARNKLSKDNRERRTITVKLLKEGRVDSDNDTNTFKLYRNDEGRLEEVDAVEAVLFDKNLPF